MLGNRWNLMWYAFCEDGLSQYYHLLFSYEDNSVIHTKWCQQRMVSSVILGIDRGSKNESGCRMLGGGISEI